MSEYEIYEQSNGTLLKIKKCPLCSRVYVSTQDNWCIDCRPKGK